MPWGKRRHDSHTNFDLISISRVKKIPFEDSEPTRLSIRVMGTTLSSVTPTHFALHPAVNHPSHHHGCRNIYQTLTLIRPSNTILTNGSKLRSPTNFSVSESQKWKLRRAPGSGLTTPRSGPAIAMAAIKAIDDHRMLDGT